jgi:hypothetical protein
MTTVAIVCGSILVLIGLAGYVYGLSSGHASPTALIPAAFGLVIAILAAIGRARDSLRKHMMHIAVLFGLLGFILPAGRLLANYNSFALGAATISQIAMALVCLIFVILAVKSFIDARRTPVD